MTHTTLFRSNRSQAIRFPKNVAFPEGVRDVVILRDGIRRIIVPADRVRDDFFAAPGIGFNERSQLPAQSRDAL